MGPESPWRGRSPSAKGALRVPWIARRYNQSILKEINPEHSLEGLMLKLKLQYFKATWCEELTHLKRPWCWERLKAEGEGDDRGWDGWKASLTQWTWVWVNSRSWWWTGRPGVLRFMGSQRVGGDWATELNWREPCQVGPAQRGPPGCRREEWTLGGGWVAPGTETQLAGTLVSFPSHSPPAPLGFLFFFLMMSWRWASHTGQQGGQCRRVTLWDGFLKVHSGRSVARAGLWVRHRTQAVSINRPSNANPLFLALINRVFTQGTAREKANSIIHVLSGGPYGQDWSAYQISASQGTGFWKASSFLKSLCVTNERNGNQVNTHWAGLICQGQY